MKFPKSIYFILCYVLGEMFFIFGIYVTLSLYFVDVLMFNKNTAIVMYHTYKILGFIFALIGGIIADSWLGKYRTIIYFSFSSIIGAMLLSASSIPLFNLSTREFSMIGLLFIVAGSGGLTPCITTFGGDQFKMPEQETLVSTYFAFYFLTSDLGRLLSTLIIPILRNDIPCFDRNTCYPLAHLILTILMIISLVIFVSAKPLYKINKPDHNACLNFIKCIFHAIVGKIKCKEKKEHWLDYAEDRYDKRTIKDVRTVLNIWKVLTPIPVFYALHDQLGSSWVFQGTHMDGEVFNYLMKPDQLQLLNSLLMAILIPFFQFYVYPFIGKYLYINTLLRKITVGGILAGIAFIVSGILEINLEPTYLIQPSDGFAQIRIFNTLDCNASININDQTFILKRLDVYQNIKIPVKKNATLKFVAKFNNCHFIDYEPSLSKNLIVQENKATSWVLTKNGLSSAFSDFVQKSNSGDPLVRALIYVDSHSANDTSLQLNSQKMNYTISLKKEEIFTNFIKLDPNHYKALINGIVIEENISIRYGGVYTIVGYVSENTKVMRIVTLVNPNSIHLFWQIPQYILITIGEIMLQIVVGEFLFSQAPLCMKSLSFAGLMFIVTFGNLMVIIMAKARFFQRQVFETFLFAIFMFIDMFIFIILARSYKYVEIPSDESLGETLNL